MLVTMFQRQYLPVLMLIMSCIADTKTVNYQSPLSAFGGKSGNDNQRVRTPRCFYFHKIAIHFLVLFDSHLYLVMLHVVEKKVASCKIRPLKAVAVTTCNICILELFFLSHRGHLLNYIFQIYAFLIILIFSL